MKFVRISLYIKPKKIAKNEDDTLTFFLVPENQANSSQRIQYRNRYVNHCPNLYNKSQKSFFLFM